jgi:2-haloacid dehalogenase
LLASGGDFSLGPTRSLASASKRKYIISPLSNASFIGMVDLARSAGLPWDCVITAENARCYKPRPEVYRTAIDLLGLTPGEVMMVAAHNYDLAAACRGHGDGVCPASA